MVGLVCCPHELQSHYNIIQLKNFILFFILVEMGHFRKDGML